MSGYGPPSQSSGPPDGHPAAEGSDGATKLVREISATLPHNLEAEQALLGALLLDNRALEQAGESLNDGVWFDPVHQRLWQVINQRIRAGSLADVVTVHGVLAASGALTELGGAKYLHQLINAACDVYAVRDYADLIEQLALRRAMIDQGLTLAATASQGGDGSAAAILGAAQQALGALEPGSAYEPVSAIGAAHQAVAEAREALASGKQPGLSTGYEEIDDRHGRLREGNFVIIGGRPGMGKSALALELARKMVQAGTGVGYFSMEMTALEQGQRLLSAFCGEGKHMVEYEDIAMGRVSPAEVALLDRYSRMCERLPLLFDDRSSLPFEQLRGRIAAMKRRMRERHGTTLKVVFFDHLGLMIPPKLNGGGFNKVAQISEITAELKRIAGDMGITIVALSQLSRGLEARPDKRPILSDLRDSGSIEQDASSVIFVYREGKYLADEMDRLQAAGQRDSAEFLALQERAQRVRDDVELIVAKRRGGRTGIIKMRMRIEMNLLTSLAERDESPEQGTMF